MNRFYLILLLFFSFTVLQPQQIFAQNAVKPTIMVLPSRDWMVENRYARIEVVDGVTETIMDYESALLNYPDLNAALEKISAEFKKSGFNTENLLQVLDGLKTDAIEETRRTSKSGSKIRVNDIDEIRKRAKTDIEVYLYWKIVPLGPKKRVSDFRILAVDAWTSNNIGFGPSGSGDWVLSQEVSNADLLREAVLSQMDGFKASLQSTFEDMFVNGRELKLSIRTWEDAPFDLESDQFGDDELSVLIKNYVRKNSFQGRFSAPTLSETRMEFKSVRIPTMVNGERIDGEDWARGLKKYLEQELKVKPVKVDPVGVGHVILILGGK
jgi:hypothetical protein